MVRLGYDSTAPRWWRLRTIGAVEIRYEGNRPCAIGAWPLDYDPQGAHRLVGFAGRDVRYRVWLGTVRALGAWRVRYGAIVPLLRQVGPFPVEHRGPRLRPSRVGPATLRYGPGEPRADALVLPSPDAEPSDDLLLAVAFTLLEHLWRPTANG